MCRLPLGITTLSYLYIKLPHATGKKNLSLCLLGYLQLQHALLALTVMRTEHDCRYVYTI